MSNHIAVLAILLLICVAVLSFGAPLMLNHLPMIDSLK
jgi:hypothetical protein